MDSGDAPSAFRKDGGVPGDFHFTFNKDTAYAYSQATLGFRLRDADNAAHKRR